MPVKISFYNRKGQENTQDCHNVHFTKQVIITAMYTRFSINDMLQISVVPEIVYITTDPDQSSYADISVTIKNTDTQSVPVNSVAITLPAALAPAVSLGTIIPVPDKSRLFNFSPSAIDAGEFDATPASGASAQLNPGELCVFTLQSVTLAGPVTQAQAAVTVSVIFGGGSAYSVSPVIKMAPAVAGIISFNSKLSDINPGETVTLSWQCIEMDYCIISPGDGTHLGASGELDVSPPSTTNYTLYAYGDGVILSAQWGITVDYPQIMKFGGEDGQPSVDYGDNITLVWECNHTPVNCNQ